MRYSALLLHNFIVDTLIIKHVNLYMYADDIVIASRAQEELQAAFNCLTDWAADNDLDINDSQTMMMVFRKGGRLSANTGITYKGKKLNIVDSFKYLGLTFQTQGCVFARHIKERASAAIIAMNDIRCLSELGMETALRFFRLEITPIATYGFEIIWEYLTKRDFMELERLKATFLKKAMCLSKYTPSLLVYELAKEPFYIEELRCQLLLPSTVNLQTLMLELHEKKKEIWTNFYSTDAMLTTECTRGGYDLWKCVTWFVVHREKLRLLRRENSF